MLCDLQVFSGRSGVYHLKQPRTQSLFLFPIVFGIDNFNSDAIQKVFMHMMHCRKNEERGRYLQKRRKKRGGGRLYVGCQLGQVELIY